MEEFLQLFDSFWFEHKIFKRKSSSPPQTENQDRQIHREQEILFEESKLSRLPTLKIRSMSDQFLSSSCSKMSSVSESESPNSVLVSTPKLQTILSGKEVSEFDKEQGTKTEEKVEVSIKKKKNFIRRNSRRRNGSSKNLTDLEFEEVQGFMDLGFVFSEEDRRDSSLVSIIPGLQRLGRRKSGDDEDELGERKKNENAENGNVVVVSRPYLSEAWEFMDDRKRNKEDLMKNPLMNWRIPALVNDMEMRDHLRFWAHTVASTVR